MPRLPPPPLELLNAFGGCFLPCVSHSLLYGTETLFSCPRNWSPSSLLAYSLVFRSNLSFPHFQCFFFSLIEEARYTRDFSSFLFFARKWGPSVISPIPARCEEVAHPPPCFAANFFRLCLPLLQRGLSPCNLVLNDTQELLPPSFDGEKIGSAGSAEVFFISSLVFFPRSFSVTCHVPPLESFSTPFPLASPRRPTRATTLPQYCQFFFSFFSLK